MGSDLTRAVIVVFRESTTDTEAAMVRNGLNMFKGVEKLVPVRGVPDERQSRLILARDQLMVECEKLRQERDELAWRVHHAQEAVTGPVPGLDTSEEPIAAVFDRNSDLRKAR